MIDGARLKSSIYTISLVNESYENFTSNGLTKQLFKSYVSGGRTTVFLTG